MPSKEDYSRACINTEFGIAHASTIMGKLERFFTSFFARSSPPDRAKKCSLCLCVSVVNHDVLGIFLNQDGVCAALVLI